MKIFHLENALKALLNIEELIDQGSTQDTLWLCGQDRSGLTSHRYLMFVCESIEPLKVLQDNYDVTPRILSKTLRANVSSGVLESTKIDTVLVLKTSPGAPPDYNLKGSTPMHVLHINDLTSKLLLRRNLSDIHHHIDELKSPIREVAISTGRDVVAARARNLSDSSESDACTAMLSWLNATNAPPFITLFSLGGLGKSTLIQRVARRLWEDFVSYKSLRFPVIAAMGGIPAGAKYDIPAHITTFDLFRTNTTNTQVRELMRSGLLVVFLDAFDEHLKFANRADAIRFLQHLRDDFAGHDGARIILTSRDYYLMSDALFDQCLHSNYDKWRLLPFNEEERRRFLNLRLGSALKKSTLEKWVDALENVARNLPEASDSDYLIGHALFLLAFCLFVSRIERDTSAVSGSVTSPEDFARIESSNLFEQVIGLINEREAEEKSKWEEAIYSSLTQEWEESPFSTKKQHRYFAEVAQYVATRPSYYNDPPRISVIHGCLAEAACEKALRAAVGIPQALSSISREARERVELEAFQTIAEFFCQHPLVDPENTGLLQRTHFSFKYPTYRDFFVKEYLVGLVDEIENQDGSIDTDALSLAILELRDSRILEGAASCLYFLCWDIRETQRMGHVLEKSLHSYTSMDSEILAYLLTYCLVFSKIHQEMKGRHLDVRGLALDNMDNASNYPVEMDGRELNPYLQGISISLCSIGNIHLRDAVFENCNLINISVRQLGLEGIIAFKGGKLFLLGAPADDGEVDSRALEEVLYTIGHVEILLDSVTVHCGTLEALRILADRHGGRVTLRCTDINVIDFNIEDEPIQDPAKRFADQMMRLVRKHGKGIFGVSKHKLHGRSPVQAEMRAKIESILENSGYFKFKGNILLVEDDSCMYHPDGWYGRSFEQVADLWQPILAQLSKVFL